MRNKLPGNGPNPLVKVPPFWTKTLSNGIKTIGTQNSEVPVVTLSLSIPGGHLLQANQTSKVGLASTFADMMNEDTKNYTSEQFTVELQKIGSSIRVGSGTDEITITVQTLKKNLDRTLALLEERLFNPNFTEATFKRVQRQNIGATAPGQSTTCIRGQQRDRKSELRCGQHHGDGPERYRNYAQ